MTKPNFSIGFDRFVDLEWANYAYGLAQENSSKDGKKKHLAKWIRGHISGEESARKTSNVLFNLWFQNYSTIEDLRSKAFKIGKNKQDILSQAIVQYGMAINVYSFFRDVCIITGRLASIQGVIVRNEIHQRMLEKYGNVGSVPRATDRVLQSLVNWDFLHLNSGAYKLRSIWVSSEDVASWLAEALVVANPLQRLPVSDLVHSPELLGIRLDRNTIGKSEMLTIERDGTNIEFVKVTNTLL